MNYLVVDLEMTGGDPSWHEIISIGAVLYTEEWQELGRYRSLVYPENEEAFSRPSESVHGISLQELKEAPMLDDVLPGFEEWMLGCRNLRPGAYDNAHLLKHTMICGLGIVNDYAFLRAAYGIINRNWPFSYRLLDLQTLTHTLFPVFRAAGLPAPSRHSLDAVAGFFGLEREGESHDALEDALLTGRCFQKLMKMVEKLKYEA